MEKKELSGVIAVLIEPIQTSQGVYGLKRSSCSLGQKKNGNKCNIHETTQ